MIFFKILGLIVVILFLSSLGFITYLHFRTQFSSVQQTFLSGTVPKDLPDGFYQGSVNIKNVPWLGKKFDLENQTGINIVQRSTRVTESFPFKTSVGQGTVDPELTVIKIDYNLPENHPALRMVLDEIVETEPNHYLGKLQIRILPNLTIALGYFELDKSSGY